MTSPRLSWVQKEKIENQAILLKFWEKYIAGKTRDDIAKSDPIANIKNRFLASFPPAGVIKKSWEDKLNLAWVDHSAFKNFEDFSEYFKHVPSLKPVGIAEGLLPEQKELKSAKITTDTLDDLKQYTSDKNLSVSALLGSAKTGETVAFCSGENKKSDIFSLQSIGKVFTGILALAMVREGIISEEDFAKKKIKVDDSVKTKLMHAPLILDRLQEVTLHQALTHQGGFAEGAGDYLKNYAKEIEEKQIPEIKAIEDFLPFVPNEVSPVGEYHYSNTGMLLGGLSLQYLYNRHREEHPEKKLEPLDFDGLMQKYVIKPAGMSFFTSKPPSDFKFNQEHKAARYIVGSPAGGSFTTLEDLKKFGEWLYKEYHKQPSFTVLPLTELVSKYGQEFSHHKKIMHSGDAPSGSAYFSLDLQTGNVVIVFNDQRPVAASEVGRAIQENIFTEKAKELRVAAKQYSFMGSATSKQKTMISKKEGKSTGSTFFTSKDTSMDVTDEQMARSTFGQGSNVAKAFRKK